MPWCATKVDENGRAVPGQFGYCITSKSPRRECYSKQDELLEISAESLITTKFSYSSDKFLDPKNDIAKLMRAKIRSVVQVQKHVTPFPYLNAYRQLLHENKGFDFLS